jgi:hypothetical protein
VERPGSWTPGPRETASWKVIKSTNANSSRRRAKAILKAVYKPARIKGAAVRQLVSRKLRSTLVSRFSHR